MNDITLKQQSGFQLLVETQLGVGQVWLVPCIRLFNCVAYLVKGVNYWNSRQWQTGKTTDKFQCNNAAYWNGDMFSTTGAYSPRNEAYVNADRFLKLWYEVIGREIAPFSEYFTSPHNRCSLAVFRVVCSHVIRQSKQL